MQHALWLVSLFLAGTTLATPFCGAGSYYDQNAATPACKYCAPGTYNSDNQNPQTSCQPAQSGFYACGTMTGPGGQTCYGATGQDPCQGGSYSQSGASQCTQCSPGYVCPGTQQTQQQQCTPGHYMDQAGSSMQVCKNCPVGTYNNAYAATTCCQCCPGTFNNQETQTHCFDCGEQTSYARLYSSAGSTSKDQCQASMVPNQMYDNSCKNTPPVQQAGQEMCPNGVSPATPTGKMGRRASLSCVRGLTLCPHYSGRGGFECVNTHKDAESCGGCVGFEGLGQDCTAIPNATNVLCKQKKCVVKTCMKGYRVSKDKTSCELTVYGAVFQAQKRSRHHTS